MECAPLGSVDGNALPGIFNDAARRERARVQTDCKRPARYSPPGDVTRRHMPRSKHARPGTCSPMLAASVTVLGKLMTQRSQVQILSPRRNEAAGRKRHPIAVSSVSRVRRDQAQVEMWLVAGVGRVETLEAF